MNAPAYKWQPTTAEIAAATGLRPDEVERFDHNTSPFTSGWVPEVAEAALRNTNEYPGASYRALREAAANLNGLQPEQIVPGAGADEMILLSARAFLNRGDTAIAATPTYPLYEIATIQAGAVFQPVPSSSPSFTYPRDEVVGAARDADMVWVCAPSNPIGNDVGDDVIDSIVAATDGLVVIDAAYAEFTDSDWPGRVQRHHNIIVLRTMSKAFGIAGARVGYAMAHPDLIAAIDRIRPPGSISSISTEIAIGALQRPDAMEETVERILDLRTALSTALAGVGFRALPSLTNFVLCEVGPNAHQLAEQLIGEGLVVRKFPTGGPLDQYLRFTVRTAAANSRLITTIERYLP